MIKIEVTGVDEVSAEIDRVTREAIREQRRRVILLLLVIAAILAGGIWTAIRLFGK